MTTRKESEDHAPTEEIMEYPPMKTILNTTKKRTGRGGDFGGLTLDEVASILGISPERVRQIEKIALSKLKRPMLGRELKEYLTI